jgi:DNA (cytosine-5)-methyltransferase 1
LALKKGVLDVLVGGPPCQGFSINAPERFLTDKRNKLFKDYVRFLEEFEPKAFLFENVPGLLSIGDGKVFRQIVREFQEHGYHVTPKIRNCSRGCFLRRSSSVLTDFPGHSSPDSLTYGG